MAFDRAYFSRAGGNAAAQLFTYYTNDDQGTVIASAYFDDLIDDLNVGDIIIAVFDADGTIGVSELMVTSVTTHVTTSDNVTQT